MSQSPALTEKASQELQALEQALALRAGSWGSSWTAPSEKPADIAELKQRLEQLQIVAAELTRVSRDSMDQEDRRRQKRLRAMIRRIRDEGSKASLQRVLHALGGLSVSDNTDRFGFDPDYEKFWQPLLDFLYEDYWRIEVEGGHHIPRSGAAMLVPNHAGLLPFDALMLRQAVRRNHAGERRVRCLVEDWFYKRPMLGVAMSRLGCVRACPENAEALLRDDELIAVFPEGIQGVAKSFSQRYKIKRFGRGGAVKLASQMQVPMVPTAIVGSEEIYPILWQSRRLSRILGFRFFPLTPQFPLLGPFALVPLPSAWSIRFSEPMTVELPSEESENYEIALHTTNETLRSKVQSETIDLFAGRRSSFWR